MTASTEMANSAYVDFGIFRKSFRRTETLTRRLAALFFRLGLPSTIFGTFGRASANPLAFSLFFLMPCRIKKRTTLVARDADNSQLREIYMFE